MNPTSVEQANLIATLTKSTPAYKRNAWLAMGGLAVFLLLYFMLAGWFLLTAYRLTFGATVGGEDTFWGYLVGGCAAFLAVFMLKGIFFVKHGGSHDAVEITPQQQPKLFEFLYQLADNAAAPRPYKVFLSPLVNAAVFYDLSILNLLFASKKNLEIGLGLVNSLTLGEFRAVLAHEFGHFAQRAMAVGRWVYIAQQIAANLVARRDKLDGFLNGLSRVDLRVAWIGWLMRLIVWSIRSIVESAFSLVLLLQRALSREMELHADLVAVSLTGSDALIHALHRLHAADDAWRRAMGFVKGEKAEGRVTRDLFAIQSRISARMSEILNDPGYGQVPPVPTERPQDHRLFKAELAQPPQMWLTHPLNHEREANAKRRYVHAPIDEHSAWELFDNPSALREQVSAKLFAPGKSVTASDEESLQTVDRQFDREFLKSRYRGIYLGRSVVRCATKPEALYEPGRVVELQELDRLYPESLTEEVERLRTLEMDLDQLRALLSGVLEPPGGVIRHRGKDWKLQELPQVIEEVEREVAAVEERLQAHDRLCRSAHCAVAGHLGGGWEEYLRGLLAAVHYADHTAANLRDAQGLLAKVVAEVTAAGRVSSSGMERTVKAANELHLILQSVFAQRDQVVLDRTLTERLQTTNWAETLGELKLVAATNENISQWLNVVDGWVDQSAGACSALRDGALEQLLLSEMAVANYFRLETQAPSAPAPTRVPRLYDTLVPGRERRPDIHLDWWARFQTADGVLPAAARLLVAAGIVAAVLGFGNRVGNATVTIYNGLARPLRVEIGGKKVDLEPFASASLQMDADRSYRVQARTLQGQSIESFDADVRGSFSHFVYNVASASPLVEWTVTYGSAETQPEKLLGMPRWSTSSADFLFEEPPKSISTSSGRATREVLTGLGNTSPNRQLGTLKNEADQKRLIAAHARWDLSNSRYLSHWLGLAMELPEHRAILSTRLSETPDDILILRMEQDSAAEVDRAEVCTRHQKRAEAAPQNPDMQYLAARCLADPAKTQAFVAGHKRWFNHGWFAYAAGYSEAEAGHWPEALRALEQARNQVPSLAETVSVDLARIRRLVAQGRPPMLEELAKDSEQLQFLLALESGQGLDTPQLKAYPELARGNLAQALRLAGSDSDTQARLLRLVAASDGADPGVVSRALSLSIEKGVDAGTVWASLGLAVLQQRDSAPYQQAARRFAGKHAEPILRFMEVVRKGKDLEAAERLLDGLPLELRGQGYSVGAIVLGNKAPQPWRNTAKQLLFASERPYFSPGTLLLSVSDVQHP